MPAGEEGYLVSASACPPPLSSSSPPGPQRSSDGVLLRPGWSGWRFSAVAPQTSGSGSSGPERQEVKEELPAVCWRTHLSTTHVPRVSGLSQRRGGSVPGVCRHLSVALGLPLQVFDPLMQVFRPPTHQFGLGVEQRVPGLKDGREITFQHLRCGRTGTCCPVLRGQLGFGSRRCSGWLLPGHRSPHLELVPPRKCLC